MKVSEHLNPAFSVIQQAVEAGKFASGYERYVENVIKVENTFFTKILREQGQEAALKALENWESSDHLLTFAHQLEPIAKAIAELSRVDEGCQLVRLLSAEEAESFVFWAQSKDSQIVIFLNDEVQRICNGQNNWAEWSCVGAMQLQAVALRIGQKSADIGLFFPSVRDLQKESGHVFVEINQFGQTSAIIHEPRPFTAKQFLRLQMGLVRSDRGHTLFRRSVSVGEALGHPCAFDYMAQKLHRLPDFVKSLAIGYGQMIR